MGSWYGHWPCGGGGARLTLDQEFDLWINDRTTDETFWEYLSRVMYFECGCRGMFRQQAAA